VGTLPALDLLIEVGVDEIHRHDLGLANVLRAQLGLPPGDSAIVTVAADGALERLQAAGIKASVRAGAVRISFHLHNTDADVDALARAPGRVRRSCAGQSPMRAMTGYPSKPASKRRIRPTASRSIAAT
jgi:selenocysteine lyase/cysteine desulfurase